MKAFGSSGSRTKLFATLKSRRMWALWPEICTGASTNTLMEIEPVAPQCTIAGVPSECTIPDESVSSTTRIARNSAGASCAVPSSSVVPF